MMRWLYSRLFGPEAARLATRRKWRRMVRRWRREIDQLRQIRAERFQAFLRAYHSRTKASDNAMEKRIWYSQRDTINRRIEDRERCVTAGMAVIAENDL